jgi:hypothetical protein
MVRAAGAEVALPSFSMAQLAKRWAVSLDVIILEEPDHTAEPDRHYRNEVFRSKLRVMREEVERFEREHLGFGRKGGREGQVAEAPKPTGKRSSMHRERCRAIAAMIWGHEPALTIADMINRPEITKHGQEGAPYTADTLRKWIRDLCPNPHPGRPRKLP